MFTGPYGVREHGTWQKWLLTRPEDLALVPDEIEDTVAASLPVAYLTAQTALALAKFTPGKSVLAPGIGGSVGNATYQLARALGYSAGRKTTIDVTDLIWKRARMAGFSLFAQSPTAIAAAWREIIPLVVNGSIKPIVERVYPFNEAGEALRHLIEDRPFGKVVLPG